MKTISKITILIISVITIVTASIIVYAEQENNTDDNDVCFCHEYQVSYFDKNTGIATFRCIYCGNEYDDSFESHINEQNYEPLDLNNDNIINAKDFAYLTNNYQPKANTN